MLEAVQCAQKLIMQQFGSLTTLVLTMVLKCKHSRAPWVSLSVTVGDSAAYILRRRSMQVEELTAASHHKLARWGRGRRGGGTWQREREGQGGREVRNSPWSQF